MGRKVFDPSGGEIVIIQIVRYRPGLSDGEVQELFEERAAGYRKVDGLLQKYYVRFPETGEVGGIYVWDSEDSLRRWRAGNLAGTLASTYKVEGEAKAELAEVTLVLHPEDIPTAGNPAVGLGPRDGPL